MKWCIPLIAVLCMTSFNSQCSDVSGVVGGYDVTGGVIVPADEIPSYEDKPENPPAAGRGDQDVEEMGAVISPRPALEEEDME